MLLAQDTPFLALDPLANSTDDALRYSDNTTDASYPSMYQTYADRSESSSRRHSPSTSGRNTPNSFSAPSMTLGRNQLFNDKVSLPPIGAMFNTPGDDLYESRRNSLPYPSANRSIPSGAAQWLPGLGVHNDDALRPRGSTGSGASTGSPNSPASSSPSFTTGYSSSSTAPTTVKSSPGTSPFSDRLSLPAAPSTTGREWSAPVTIPVPPSDNNTLSSGHSASPTPLSDSPPAATSAAAAPPARRRGKLPKHVTETLRTWLLSHADHPYPTEEEKKMLCNVTSLTLSQVSNWMINARRRILVPASKQQAALNATTGPYLGMARSSAATDLARANRQSMNIPHTLSSHALPHSHSDPYAGAYTLPPHLSPAGDLHLSASRNSYPTLATGGRPSYTYPPPNIQNYYGNGLSGVTAGLASYNAGLVQGGSGRYYGDQDHSYSATH